MRFKAKKKNRNHFKFSASWNFPNNLDLGVLGLTQSSKILPGHKEVLPKQTAMEREGPV